MDMKTLIAYYSRGGTTARTAKQLQEIVGGDLFEIKGEKDYGSYFHALGVAKKEFSSGEILKVTTEVNDFDSYDRILVGFPIWYSKCPQLVISFLQSHDVTGKDVFPFCTSGMSGPEGTEAQLQAACKGAKLHSGIRLNKVDPSAVTEWLNRPAK